MPSLQAPVVMEYVVSEIIEQICNEIENDNIDLFRTHALVKAQAKDYIRAIQIRLILQPICDRLIARLGSKAALESRLNQILSQLHGTKPKKSPDSLPHRPPPTALSLSQETGYACGNLLNLLRQLGTNVNGYDFSLPHSLASQPSGDGTAQCQFCLR